MSDAKVEQIIAAIKTTVTGLTTTGARVQRGQIYNHEEADLPALSIVMGDDQVEAEYQTEQVDWSLIVKIISTADIESDYITTDSLIDQALNQIRKEVYAAVMADHKQGLAFVIDTTPVSASEPDLSGAGARPIGSQVNEFLIRYRANRQDLSA